MPVIVTGDELSKGYVAPTVFLRRALPATLNYWDYWDSLYAAFSHFIEPIIPPAGRIYFKANEIPQTMGINVDFYVIINGKWQAVDFGYMKNNPAASGVIRFYTTQGAGAFYTIYNPYYFGATATVLTNYSPDKLAALDSFYRNVALMKYRYNSLVGFLNAMAVRQLSTREQQIFNEGILKLQNLSNQINTIEGIEISYTDKGAVVGLPIILIIAIILILASATAWTVSTVLTESEKTKRINDSFELNKWIADKKLEVAQAVTAGTITQSQANEIYKTLDAAASIGNKVAVESTKQTDSIFKDLGSLIKWGVVGLGVYYGYKLLKPAGNGSN